MSSLTLGIAVHDLLDLAERSLIYVLKNGYCVVSRRRGDDIRVAVVVEVGHGHALCVFRQDKCKTELLQVKDTMDAFRVPQDTKQMV